MRRQHWRIRSEAVSDGRGSTSKYTSRTRGMTSLSRTKDDVARPREVASPPSPHLTFTGGYTRLTVPVSATTLRKRSSRIAANIETDRSCVIRPTSPGSELRQRRSAKYAEPMNR